MSRSNALMLYVYPVNDPEHGYWTEDTEAVREYVRHSLQQKCDIRDHKGRSRTLSGEWTDSQPQHTAKDIARLVLEEQHSNEATTFD